MHLKSLTIKGFKSFARPTTFQFEPGVTAIVGPNGSGKSNVVDALAWVMGEQGAKTLRGGKMEDVIFAGTESRGPLGRAEVKLTIDNSDGALPIEYSEVTISRTLFRSGSSEYAINGENCRLLDVQELLSDSGLGREMHVIVGQGQLDAVLRATPEDRRGFIEEAAGILKHRRRKERTLRKLEAMEQNLTRLQDLANEIRRQLGPLGRQAEVARSAQSIAAEVRDAKARLLADDVARLRHELNELAQTEGDRHAERTVLEAQHEQKQLRMTELESAQLGDELDEARRVTVALEGAQQKLRGLLAQTQQRLTFLATQAEAPDQLHRISRGVVDEAAAESVRLAQLVPSAEGAWRVAQSASLKARAQLDALDEHINEQSALVSKHDLTLSRLRGEAEVAAQRHQALTQEHDRRAQAVAQAEERARAAHDALDEFLVAGSDADTATGTDLVEGENTPEQLEAAHRETQEAQTAAERMRDEARDALHELERERAGLEARVAALTGLLDARDASADLLSGDQPGISGRVSDHVRVTPGLEAAVGLALGANVDALLADSLPDAAAAVTAARTGDLGVVRTVIAGASDLDADSDAAYSSERSSKLLGAAAAVGATALADAIISAPAGVRALLAMSFAADDLDHAARVAEALSIVLQQTTTPNSQYRGFTVVTAAGDIVTEHTVTGGSGRSKTSLETAAELERAAAEVERLQSLVEKATAALDERHSTLR